eukprot:1505995-Ditylum_brightwellii.AAC.1
MIETKDRLHREGRIVKQITDASTLLTERLEQETSQRDAVVTELRQRITRNEEGRKDADLRFETLIEKELRALKADLEMEVMERKMEDDDIVEALN